MGLLSWLNPLKPFQYAKKKLEEGPKGSGIKSTWNISDTQKRSLYDLLKRTKPLNKQSTNVLSQLLGMDIDALSEGLGLEDLTDDFSAMEAPALEQWEQQVIPSIMERFANSGGSSGLNQMLSQGARGVTTDLAAMRNQNRWNRAQLMSQNRGNLLGAKQNALNSLLNLNQLGLNPGYKQTYYQQGQPNWFQQIAPSVAGAAGKAAIGAMI